MEQVSVEHRLLSRMLPSSTGFRDIRLLWSSSPPFRSSRSRSAKSPVGQRSLVGPALSAFSLLHHIRQAQVLGSSRLIGNRGRPDAHLAKGCGGGHADGVLGCASGGERGAAAEGQGRCTLRASPFLGTVPKCPEPVFKCPELVSGWLVGGWAGVGGGPELMLGVSFTIYLKIFR